MGIGGIDPQQAKRGFVIASASMLAVFAAGAAPIPLYSVYQQTIGLTDLQINATMFLYLLGIMAVLLFAGRLSDALGRKPVALASLALALAGCLLFAVAANPSWVLAARLVQGISCGLAMSALSSLAIEYAVIARHGTWGSTITGCGCLVGIMIGSLGCGMLTSVISPIQAVYWITAGILLALALAVATVPETVSQRRPLASTIRPSLFVPKGAGRLFFMAAAAYVSTWGVGGFFQSYSAPIATEALHADGTLLASAILACAMATSALSGPLCAHISAPRALKAGILAFLASCLMMTASLAVAATVPFLASCAFFSLTMGVCLSSSLRILLAESSAEDTSALVSSINLVGYFGCTIISCGSGMLVGTLSFPQVFVVLTLVSTVATLAIVTALHAGRTVRVAHNG